MALSMTGNGKSYYKGKLMEGDEALKKAKIQPASLSARKDLHLLMVHRL
jgi:Histidine ammonia-lyase